MGARCARALTRSPLRGSRALRSSPAGRRPKKPHLICTTSDALRVFPRGTWSRLHSGSWHRADSEAGPLTRFLRTAETRTCAWCSRSLGRAETRTRPAWSRTSQAAPVASALLLGKPSARLVGFRSSGLWIRGIRSRPLCTNCIPHTRAAVLTSVDEQALPHREGTGTDGARRAHGPADPDGRWRPGTSPPRR
jgi:hypothetical protein